MLTMLYVEDRPSDVLLMTRLLERRGGVALHVATTGTQALSVAAGLRPDVVLLDLHLPDVPGENVLQRLRAQAWFGTTPVLVLTGDASRACAERLVAVGVTAHLTKPLDVGDFFTLLTALESGASTRVARTAVPA